MEHTAVAPAAESAHSPAPAPDALETAAALASEAAETAPVPAPATPAPAILPHVMEQPAEPVILPPEAASHDKPAHLHPQVETPVMPGADLVVLPSVLQNAEGHIAKAIYNHFVPPAANDTATPQLPLVTGLTVQLAPVLKAGHTDLKLVLKGPSVAANEGLIAEHLLLMLYQSPSFASVRDRAHKPHAEHVDGAPADTLEIVIPKLTTAEYAHLVQALAAGPVVANVAELALKKEIPQQPAMHIMTPANDMGIAAPAAAMEQGQPAAAAR
jgi:hypothetical protein